MALSIIKIKLCDKLQEYWLYNQNMSVIWTTHLSFHNRKSNKQPEYIK